MALGSGADFEVYHGAAGTFLESGWSAAYGQGGLTPFKYAPPALLVLAPLGLLPLMAAKLCWAALNGLVVWDLQRRMTSMGVTPSALAVALLVVVHGLSWQMLLGNVTFFMVWGLVVVATTESSGVRGLATAGLIALKPFWLALVPVLLVARQWRAIKVTAVVLPLLALLPLAGGWGSGIEAYRSWLPTLTDPLHAHNFPKHDNQSWWGLLYRNEQALGPALWPMWLAGSAAFMLAWLTAIWRSPGNRTALAVLGVAPVVLWAGPLSWLHHQLFLWPLLAVMWQRRAQRGVRITLAGAAAVLLVITPMVLGRDRSIALELLGVPLVAFALLLAGAALLISRHDGDTPVDLPSDPPGLPSSP